MNPSCCRSPLQLAVIPPVAHAAIAVVVLVVVGVLFWIGWRWMGGARARHILKICKSASCGYCEREARDETVRTYAAQARARERARAAQRGEGT